MIDDWQLSHGPRRFGSWILAIVLVLTVWLALPSVIWADGNLPVLFAQEESQPVQVQPSKSYTLQALILLVVVGGALYSICRSSRRS